MRGLRSCVGPEGATQLRKELLRAEPIVGRVRSRFVVVAVPVSAEVACVPDAPETMLIEELVTDASIQALRQRVLHGLPWTNEVMLDASFVSPRTERLARELRAIVTPDSTRLAVRLDGVVQHAREALGRHRDIEFQGDATPGEVVDRSEDS